MALGIWQWHNLKRKGKRDRAAREKAAGRALTALLAVTTTSTSDLVVLRGRRVYSNLNFQFSPSPGGPGATVTGRIGGGRRWLSGGFRLRVVSVTVRVRVTTRARSTSRLGTCRKATATAPPLPSVPFRARGCAPRESEGAPRGPARL